jgi:acyl-CoA synthetase (AMP-forming)/AMP-acid ligase II
MDAVSYETGPSKNYPDLVGMKREETMLPEIFARVCRANPGRIAVDYSGIQISYQHLYNKVITCSDELAALGIKRGARVILAVNDPIDFIILWYALWKNKGIPIPLETSITPVELGKAAEESQCHYIIASSKNNLEHIPGLDIKSTKCFPGWRFAGIENRENGEPYPDTALFFYTSGTTGSPKCVVFDHAAMTDNIMSLARALRLSIEDRFFTPLAPVLPAVLATAVLPVLSVGGTLVLVKQPIPGKILKHLVYTSATVFFAVPYIYELLEVLMGIRNKNSWKQVRLCLSSSAFMEDRIFNSFHECTKLPIRSIYCSSEAGACTYNDSDHPALIRESVGRPLEGVELKIADKDGKRVPPGEQGQIMVRSSHTARGYYNREELRKKVFVDGWVQTGDIGTVDSAGYLRLKGRLSETINVSGHLVNPREVEEILLQHPGIAEALVFGKKDPRWGERIAARIVRSRSGAYVKTEDVLTHCGERLSHYKMPRVVEFVHELPKSRYGKLGRS